MRPMAEARATCPQCSSGLAAGARFCGECGAAVPETMVDKPLRGSHTILGLDAEAVRAAAALLEAKAKQGKGTAQEPALDSAKEPAKEADKDTAAAEGETVEEAADESAEDATLASKLQDKAEPSVVTNASSSRRSLGHTILGLSASQVLGAARQGAQSSGESTSAGGYAAPLQEGAAAPLAGAAKPSAKHTLLGIQSSSGGLAAPTDTAAAFGKTRIEGEQLGALRPAGSPGGALDLGATRVEGGAAHRRQQLVHP